ncbi:MAG TPA: M20/M25/M40 family metallo-hydrolase [Bryobacteraceae bacterium]|nr:M20/M25/M40 family metallo-hydrolase [Bryobacteraceae bacterium]
MHPVLRHIDPQVIARDTLEFVRVRSETGDEGAGSFFLAKLLEREGFEVRMEDAAPGRPNVYARVAGRGGGRALLLNGHTDTIPVGHCDAPEQEGGWVIGRGAEDMKGGLVAMVHAAAALHRAGVRLAGDLWLTGVVGHETPAGKKEGTRRLCELLRREEIRADAIVIAEGPQAIWSASLGSAIFTVEIRSPRGAIHTIKVPYAENPARWVGRLLAEFERLEGEFAAAPPHPLCGREQLNVGIVAAGDYPNRLPTPAAVTGTWRWRPGKTHAAVRAQLEEICGRLGAESGLSFEALWQAQREPFETPREHAVVRALERAGQTVAGRTPEVIGMALVGDGNLFVHDGGVPSVYYGPAHETAHSDHERVSVERLAECAGVYALAAMEFCGV